MAVFRISVKGLDQLQSLLDKVEEYGLQLRNAGEEIMKISKRIYLDGEMIQSPDNETDD